MRKVNFNTLNNLTVPPELIEKALAIPGSDAPAPYRSAGRRGRRPLLAASIVLVVLAGISAYLFFGNKSIPVKPSDSQDVPDAVDMTVPAEASLTDPTDAANPDQTQPSGIDARSGTFGSSYTVDPSVSAPAGSTPTAAAETLPDGVDFIKPGPSAAAASAPTAGHEDETQAPTPTNSNTEQPADQPTQAYEVGTDPPEDPQISPSDAAGESPIPGDPGDAQIYDSVNSSLLTGNKHVFIVLYNRAGKRVDSEPLLSPKHETIPSIGKDGYAYINYSPPEEWNLSTGMYEMELYNENGRMIQRTIVFLYYD